jgi:diguanylate cyclase (GGDEF)-like protein/PAS domain S-box-containing protein
MSDPFQSMRGRLVVAIPTVLFIALVWGAVLLLVRYERGLVIVDTIRQNENLALAFEEHTDRTIRAADQFLHLMQLEVRNGSGPEAERLLEQLRLDPAVVTSAALIDSRGLVVRAKSPRKANLADRAYFRNHAEHPDDDSLRIGVPLEGRLSGRTMIPLTRRVVSPDGRFAGIALIGLDPQYFATFYGKLNLGSAGMVLLLGTDGIVRARVQGSSVATGQDMSNANVIARQRAADAGTYLTRGRLDGVQRFVSYRTLADFGLIVAVGVSREEALAPLRERTKVYVVSGMMLTSLALIASILVLVAVERRREALRERQRLDARFRATFEQRGVGVAHASADGTLMRVNAKLADMLGYPIRDVVGRRYVEFLHPHDRPRDARQEPLVACDKPQLERRCMRRDGATLWAEVTLSPVRDAAGHPEYYVAMVQDVTEKKAAQERLQREATYDGLTELPNRRLFDERVAQALKGARRHATEGAVMFLDLDHFKDVNDHFGHAAGDALLRDVARRLSTCLRESDTAARVGGDEFAVLLARIIAPEDAALVAGKILDAMGMPIVFEGHEMRIGLSIGIAVFPRDGTDAQTLLARADAAMFGAKHAGRNGYRFHDEEPAVETA